MVMKFKRRFVLKTASSSPSKFKLLGPTRKGRILHRRPPEVTMLHVSLLGTLTGHLGYKEDANDQAKTCKQAEA
jgi:hypothetical protein